MVAHRITGIPTVTRRSGLGRGLDALLPQQGDDELETRGTIRTVATSAISTNPRQPRTHFDDESIELLAASIRELGILQPLLVRRGDGNRFELVAGERRLRAARGAGLSEVPVMIVDTDDRGALERALVENLHREDLNPIEEAEGYRALIDDAGLTQEQLAQRLSRNRVTITNALRLLDLPQEVKRLLVERRLTAAHGRALLGLQSSPFLTRLARRVGHEGLSVRETDDLVRRYRDLSEPTATRSERPPLVADAQRRLADYLQTRVRVELGKRKGKIVLDFVSLEELERLLEIITDERPGARRVSAGPEEGQRSASS